MKYLAIKHLYEFPCSAYSSRRDVLDKIQLSTLPGKHTEESTGSDNSRSIAFALPARQPLRIHATHTHQKNILHLMVKHAGKGEGDLIEVRPF